MKKVIFSLTVIFVALMAVSAFGQTGGKAEANRVRFARGKSSASVIGTLGNDEEMEYVFSARKGQSVTVTNATPRLFDFHVFTEDGSFDSDNVVKPTYTFQIPSTGDYMFFIRKIGSLPKSAKFTLTLSIK